jgi:hypothetical protein
MYTAVITYKLEDSLVGGTRGFGSKFPKHWKSRNSIYY